MLQNLPTEPMSNSKIYKSSMEMELELSLSPPVHNQTRKGFNLNHDTTNVHCYTEDQYSTLKPSSFFAKQTCHDHEDQRSLELTRFPLVSWNGYPNEDDQDGWDEQKQRISNAGHHPLDMDGDGRGIIGWPPVNSWRKKLMEEHHFEGVGIVNGNDHNMAYYQRGEDVNGINGNGNIANNGMNNNSNMFVKVKMEGVAIARKIDLNLFHSYQMLTTFLNQMFGKYEEIEKDGASYHLMYQDKEGEWLLAGNVPWQMFLDTVQRIQVVRN